MSGRQYTWKDHKREDLSNEIELGRYPDAILDTFRNVKCGKDLGTYQPEGIIGCKVFRGQE
jgi:hypothetical protein